MKVGEVCLAILVLALVAGCGPQTRAKRLTRSGDRYLKKGNYARAQRSYANSFRLHPTGNVAFKNAYCLGKVGDQTASIEALAKAAELGHDQARIVLAYYGGMTADDIREYIRTHEDDPYAWSALGERHYRSGDIEVAVGCYETALKHSDDAELGQTLCYNLAVAYLKLGRYPEAGRAFDAYAARCGSPFTDKELLLQGAVKYAQGDHATAAKAWSKLPARTRQAISKVVGDEAKELASLAMQ